MISILLQLVNKLLTKFLGGVLANRKILTTFK